MGQSGVHFYADVAILGCRPVINRTEDIRGQANVLDFNLFKEHPRIDVRSFVLHARDRSVVVSVLSNSFGEDGRVAGHAADAVFISQSFQFAICNQIAPDVIQPH